MLLLNYRRFKMNNNPTGLCSHCKEREDTEHVLLKCPQYSAQRQTEFSFLDSAELNIETLLDPSDLMAQQATLNFLNATGITRRLRLEAKQEAENATIQHSSTQQT